MSCGDTPVTVRVPAKRDLLPARDPILEADIMGRASGACHNLYRTASPALFHKVQERIAWGAREYGNAYRDYEFPKEKREELADYCVYQLLELLLHRPDESDRPAMDRWHAACQIAVGAIAHVEAAYAAIPEIKAALAQ